MADNKRQAWHLYGRLWRYGGEKSLLSALCMLVSGCGTFFVFSTVGVLLQKVLAVLNGGDLDSVLRSSALYVGGAFLFGVCSGFSDLGVATCEQSIRADFRKMILKKWILAEERDVGKFQTSDVFLRLNEDLNECTGLTGYYIGGWMISPIISGLISLAVLSALDIRLGGFCLACSLGVFAVAKGFAPRLRRLRNLRQEQQKQSVGQLADGLGGGDEVRIYGIAPVLLQKFSGVLSGLRGLDAKQARLSGTSHALQIFIADFITIAGLFVLGSWLSLQGDFPFDRILLAIPLSDQISQMVMGFSNIYTTVTNREINLRRLFQLVDVPAKDAEQPLHTIPAQTAQQADIVFSHVTFGYGKTPVLKDVSFTVKAGQKAALVGRSGSGKSTILALLLGLYDLQEGAIQINGQSWKELGKSSWLRQFSYVPQDYPLLNLSIGENIAFGRGVEGADQEALYEMAALAQVTKFAKEFTEGLEYRVGEGGKRLSGGQRQRVSIARALYRNAPIVLLDEANSAMDNQNAQELAEAFRLMEDGKTCLAVTHRLEAMEQYDVIFVVEDGCIVEYGTHMDLVEQAGVYANYVK